MSLINITGKCQLNNSGKSILQHNCNSQFPEWACRLANTGGLVSTAIWFVILLPQVIRSLRHKTMQGVSSAWAIANFTAALNNSFFVFKLSGMPLYAYISAVYMPVLEFALLVMFYYFAPRSMFKIVLTVVCAVVWIVLVSLQLALSLEFSRWMEWASIILWSGNGFPQIFLNSKRRTTRGLSNWMVAMAAVGKTTDYLGPYLLCLPLEFAVLAYFSSTASQISCLQVLWYWNQVPASVSRPSDAASVTGETSPAGGADIGGDGGEDAISNSGCEDKVVQLPVTPGCQIARWFGMSALTVELAGFVVAFVWRTGSWWALLAPAGTIGLCVGAWSLYHMRIIRCHRFWTTGNPLGDGEARISRQEALMDAATSASGG